VTRAALAAALLAVLAGAAAAESRSEFIAAWLRGYRPGPVPAARAAESDAGARVAAAALAQTKIPTLYDPSYVKLAYPGGDVPSGRGVCTDVVIRAYRKLGIDLQVGVHEDMKAHFALYPAIYGRRSPDASIDHRRVPNLMVFFGRNGVILPLSKEAKDYAPGDLVAWDLGGGVTHIGVVADAKGAGGRPQIIHNIGEGPKLEDRLFEWRIIGHFRYEPEAARVTR
jgi:uncharacterized protein YijF (DUF1287 family)